MGDSVSDSPAGAGGREGGLAGLRVLEFSSQIAGPYCAKLFGDAGAEVIKVEPPGGDSLRRHSPWADPDTRGDAALFRYLNAGKKSVAGTSAQPHVRRLLDSADLVIEAHGLALDNGEQLDVAAIRAARPALVMLSITPYGCDGPWAGRPATEFTLQAESGSIGLRGLPGGQPFQAGGRIAEWAAGTYAAAAALGALFGMRRSGRGEHVDVSIFETANLIYALFSETTNRLLNGGPGRPERAFLTPSVETPSIEPSADGYVGFCTNSSEQFANFLRLIERPDLLADRQLASVPGRAARFEEWTAMVRSWTSARTTEEITARASKLRIPVAPVLNGETVPAHEQLAERKVYVRSADGDFLQPRRPYRIDDAEPPSPGPAPGLGQPENPVAFSDDGPRWQAGDTGAAHPLPLTGLKVLDLTAWWAGPVATHHLASLGAEVIHVESPSRPDGMRLVGRGMGHRYDRWWEVGPQFMHAN
ncbi:MAG TPA: CoA transferase, partial [Acidimicrobiales bacterium]|nr:CoA transferase [Acidimicrobiales bacterium]